MQSVTQFDAIVVGAGFGGLYALHRLRKIGMTARAFETGDGVGGTWYWNRYPGARCDVESLDYSYSFSKELEQEWDWPEKFSRQPEILRYANYVADKFDLRKDIQFSTRVVSAHYDEAANLWRIETDDGRTYAARYCIMASGCLSARKKPDFKGLENFKGEWYQTSDWPHEGVDLTGKRVGVIGTGSTGIQAIPEIAKVASHVTVFQRTANFSLPTHNEPFTSEMLREEKAQYPERRRLQMQTAAGVANPIAPATLHVNDHTPEERRERFEAFWNTPNVANIMRAYKDVMVDKSVNDIVADFVRDKIREQVKDPTTAENLCPNDHPFATKRICFDVEYYQTYNRPNVSLVNIRKAPIEEITAAGIKTKDAEYPLDVIVFAIGFDAMTGALFNIDIRGRGGLPLKEKWANGPRNYLGLATAGFPNLFTVTGPLSPSVLANMILGIEHHVDWIADCLVYMRDRSLNNIEALPPAEDKWVEHVAAVGHATLFPLANSWYVGANVPGKPRVFTPYIAGFPLYRDKCSAIAAQGYEGFALKMAG